MFCVVVIILTLRQRYCHAATTLLPRYGNMVVVLRQHGYRRARIMGKG
ncbi:hypothetical protein HMPREF0673_02273 [Leyella stercorea DSM 18206]|uniref:Uncharacterized protein n=1 Tax=Leyella stercorea DSM 18206 TaxID=1002367 RepID=G6B056_9BACT|nr:hypothetical protein HMPREF0673_02273 [Leyella stercorea DSM 18206]